MGVRVSTQQRPRVTDPGDSVPLSVGVGVPLPCPPIPPMTSKEEPTAISYATPAVAGSDAVNVQITSHSSYNDNHNDDNSDNDDNNDEDDGNNNDNNDNYNNRRAVRRKAKIESAAVASVTAQSTLDGGRGSRSSRKMCAEKFLFFLLTVRRLSQKRLK